MSSGRQASDMAGSEFENSRNSAGPAGRAQPFLSRISLLGVGSKEGQDCSISHATRSEDLREQVGYRSLKCPISL
jgi:hypothetical protein